MSETQVTRLAVHIEICRRIDIDASGILVRVVSAPTGRGEVVAQLRHLRGHTLLQVNDIPIMPGTVLSSALNTIDAQGRDDVELLELTFRRAQWPPSAIEERRQHANGLFDPAELHTSLPDSVLLGHIQPRGYRKRPVKTLDHLPNGSALYFNHPNWRIGSPGSLLSLKPAALRELDLSDNGLADIGASLSRFDHLAELRLGSNRLTHLELHYLPRLRSLDLSNNELKILPELLGLPVLQDLDVSDNKIGSRESGEGLSDERGESTDGWERLAHSPLQELRSLLMANNDLKWNQAAFNARVSVLADKKNLIGLDFRGNPMTFSPRLDDLPPLKFYREWVLTQCPKLTVLDRDLVSEQERLRMLMDPTHEPETAGDGETAKVSGTGTGDMVISFAYTGFPKLSPLPVHAELLATTFTLPSSMCAEVLQRVQTSLDNLFHAPPQARFLFQPEGMPAAERAALFNIAGSDSAAELPNLPEDADTFEQLDGAPGHHRRERRRGRLHAEALLRSGVGLLTGVQVRSAENAHEAYLRSRSGRAELHHTADDAPVMLDDTSVGMQPKSAARCARAVGGG